VEAEGRGVGGRKQRTPAFLDVELHRRGDEVRDAPLGARHDVQRPHAPLHGHGHQHLARRGLFPAARQRDGGVRAASPVESLLPDAGEQVRLRPGPMPQQVVALLLAGAAPVERRRPLGDRLARRYGSRGLLRLPLPFLFRGRRESQRRHGFLDGDCAEDATNRFKRPEQLVGDHTLTHEDTERRRLGAWITSVSHTESSTWRSPVFCLLHL
jgi:hypothetical protein